jgi:periplasmic protein TonB
MFEDSTFESGGKIHSRSPAWMIATFLCNGSILLALILIPLIYPEALPRQAIAFLMQAPPLPASPQPPVQQLHPIRVLPAAQSNPFAAPRTIPHEISIASGPEPAPIENPADMGADPMGGPAGPGQPFPGQTTRQIVRPEPRGPMRVLGSVEAGLLLVKTIPEYPSIAKAAGVQGIVILQATISKVGTIEDARVISGPAMLQQAALNAVKTWRYRPYQLDGQPVAVETTVNVIFTLGR